MSRRAAATASRRPAGGVLTPPAGPPSQTSPLSPPGPPRLPPHPPPRSSPHPSSLSPALPLAGPLATAHSPSAEGGRIRPLPPAGWAAAGLWALPPPPPPDTMPTRADPAASRQRGTPRQRALSSQGLGSGPAVAAKSQIQKKGQKDTTGGPPLPRRGRGTKETQPGGTLTIFQSRGWPRRRTGGIRQWGAQKRGQGGGGNWRARRLDAHAHCQRPDRRLRLWWSCPGSYKSHWICFPDALVTGTVGTERRTDAACDTSATWGGARAAVEVPRAVVGGAGEAALTGLLVAAADPQGGNTEASTNSPDLSATSPDYCMYGDAAARVLASFVHPPADYSFSAAKVQTT